VVGGQWKDLGDLKDNKRGKRKDQGEIGSMEKGSVGRRKERRL